MVLLCGHHSDCMYRYRHKGRTRRFCMACVVEKYPEADVDNMGALLAQKEKEKSKTTKKEKTKEELVVKEGEKNVSEKI